MELRAGARLDRYELLREVARGGMGSVWAARLVGKHGFEKRFAVKTILPQHARDERFRAMLLDEARLAARLVHPNVAQTLELGEDAGILYLVMEWVEGAPLHLLMRLVQKEGGRVPLGVALRIVADVCDGLHSAHELQDDDGHPLGLVHRDVSPHNILIGTSGVAKLIDFGVAKARGRVSDETSHGSLKGKVRYMSPEQALGWKVDRRADIFALGAVLYELLTGAGPYGNQTDAIILAWLTTGRPVHALPPEVPGPVARVVKKALASAREARFATAADMRAAIESAMDECNVATAGADVASAFAEGIRSCAKRIPRSDFPPDRTLPSEPPPSLDAPAPAPAPPVVASAVPFKPRRVWPLATALLAFLGVVVVVLLVLFAGPRLRPVVAGAASVAPGYEIPPLLSASPVPPVPPPTESPTVTATPAPPDPAPKAPRLAPTRPVAPVPTPSPPTATASEPVLPPPPPPRPGCDPPYVIDPVTGRHVYRRECLGAP